MKKLTLNAEDRVIDAAKRYAQENGTSVSSLFSRFILAITSERSTETPTPRSKSLTRKATGIVSLPCDLTDKELLEEALVDRHEIES
jgi:hypothetical protein